MPRKFSVLLPFPYNDFTNHPLVPVDGFTRGMEIAPVQEAPDMNNNL